MYEPLSQHVTYPPPLLEKFAYRIVNNLSRFDSLIGCVGGGSPVVGPRRWWGVPWLSLFVVFFPSSIIIAILPGVEDQIRSTDKELSPLVPCYLCSPVFLPRDPSPLSDPFALASGRNPPRIYLLFCLSSYAIP